MQYRNDLINERQESLRWTNRLLCEKAEVFPDTLAKVKSGRPDVQYQSLCRVANALGLTMADIHQPKPQPATIGA